jgi:pyruvate dehydrogenase (quinone)
MSTTASDLMIDRLRDWGVDTIFGLPGDGINGFMEALRKRTTGFGTCTFATRRSRRWRRWATQSSPASSACASRPPAPDPIHLANGLLDARLDGAPIPGAVGGGLLTTAWGAATLLLLISVACVAAFLTTMPGAVSRNG